MAISMYTRLPVKIFTTKIRQTITQILQIDFLHFDIDMILILSILYFDLDMAMTLKNFYFDLDIILTLSGLGLRSTFNI